MREIAKLVLAVALVTAAACDLDYVPDVGDLQASAVIVDASLDDPNPSGAPGLCSDSNPAVVVSFSRDIRPLLSRSPGGCNCHASNQAGGFTLGTYEGLRRGGQNSGTDIVIPGKPCQSLFYQKLGLAPPFGARMPYNGPPFFNATELTLVRDWIAEGAKNN